MSSQYIIIYRYPDWTRGSARRSFLAKPVETVYFNCPIKSSEIERSIGRIVCEFEFVRLCSAIELNRLIKFE